MVPILVWLILFLFSLFFLVWGIHSKVVWARLFGSLLLMAAGITLLASGGLLTDYLLIDGTSVPYTYSEVGFATTGTWLYPFGIAIILIGFVTIFYGRAGDRTHKSMDPFFS